MAVEHLNVRQLIELLKEYPEDLAVVVQSYEEGYDPVTDVQEITVTETPNRVWYIGVYEQSYEQGERVLLISSKYNKTDIEV